MYTQTLNTKNYGRKDMRAFYTIGVIPERGGKENFDFWGEGPVQAMIIKPRPLIYLYFKGFNVDFRGLGLMITGSTERMM